MKDACQKNSEESLLNESLESPQIEQDSSTAVTETSQLEYDKSAIRKDTSDPSCEKDIEQTCCEQSADPNNNTEELVTENNDKVENEDRNNETLDLNSHQSEAGSPEMKATATVPPFLNFGGMRNHTQEHPLASPAPTS